LGAGKTEEEKSNRQANRPSFASRCPCAQQQRWLRTDQSNAVKRCVNRLKGTQPYVPVRFLAMLQLGRHQNRAVNIVEPDAISIRADASLF
jgi:hypothetical protein